MNLKQIILEVVDIPPTPQILPKLLKLLRNPNCDIEDITALLKIDVSLSAKVLYYASSAFYGSAPASGLDSAIQRIGFREVNRLVSFAASRSALDKPVNAYQLKKGVLVKNSLATAQVMHSLGGTIDRELSDSFYTCGLLHSIGKIVIDQYLETKGLSLYQGNESFPETEKEVSIAWEEKILGFNHADAGAALLENWKFDEKITEAIRHQFEPAKADVGPKMCHCLYFANQCGPNFRKAEEGGEPEIPAIVEGTKAVTGLSDEQVHECFKTGFNEYQKALKLL